MNNLAGEESLADYTRWPQWHKQGGGGAVFSNPTSILWFLRKHKKRLVVAGAVILRGGPGGHLVHPEIFEREALQIMREESAANSEAA